MVRPSALAVLRLITSSNLVGCSTGKSAGVAPRRILFTSLRRERLFRLRRYRSSSTPPTLPSCAADRLPGDGTLPRSQ